MSLYQKYINEIGEREAAKLNPKPIDSSSLLEEIITQILDQNHPERKKSLDFLIYNVLPGTTSAAVVKANFLKDIILKNYQVDEISEDFAFELLSHMKGGQSINVLLDLAFSDDLEIASKAANVLKTQVFLYDADTNRLKLAYESGNMIAKQILESYVKAEFFTKLPELEERIEIITYVAGVGDISTDLLSPGSEAHSRSDRELHGKCLISTEAQQEIVEMQKKHPNKRIMMIAEKGTMGVGSSRMSGVNNVALWIGKQASPYVPFVNIAPIVAGTNGISPIFLTTVDVTGGIGVDLKNWRKKKDENGNNIEDEDGEPLLLSLIHI